MMPFIRYFKTVGVFCGFAVCANAAQAPQQINIKQLSTTVEDVVVPLPNEIFGALNKLGTVNWRHMSAVTRDRTSPSVLVLLSCLGQSSRMALSPCRRKTQKP